MNYYLPVRYRRVARLAGQGLGNKDIANKANLSEKTVKNYLRFIYEEFGINSKLELIRDLHLPLNSPLRRL